MSEFIINAIVLVYGDGLALKCSEWMDKIWEVITEVFNNGLVDNAFTAFSAVSASLLILYFLMDMTSQVSRELLTLEKFIVMGIKYVIAIVILLNVTDLVNGIVTIGKALYNQAVVLDLGDLNTDGASTYSNYKAANGYNDTQAKEAMVEAYDGYVGTDILDIFPKLGHVLRCFVPWLIGFVCQLVCMLIVTTNALNIFIRGFFIPLAVPQLFEDGMRSSGVRYIKSFTAYCIEMAVIVITLRFSSHLGNYITTSIYNFSTGFFESNGGATIFNASFIDQGLDFNNLIPALIPMLAAIAGISGAAKVTHDITGA